MDSIKESKTSRHTETEEAVNWDFVADRRAGSVVGADLIGGVFGFLKGGFVGALLWGTLSTARIGLQYWAWVIRELDKD